MPIARFQMPDGRVARFEVPEGTSPEQAQAQIEQILSQQQQSAPAPQQQPTQKAPATPEQPNQEPWYTRTPQYAYFKGILDNFGNVAEAYKAAFQGENPLPAASQALLNAPGGVATESALTALSGAPAAVLAGLSGIATTAADGADAGAEVTRDVMSNLTYTPRGQAAPAMMLPVGEGMQKLQNLTGEGAVAAGEALGVDPNSSGAAALYAGGSLVPDLAAMAVPALRAKPGRSPAAIQALQQGADDAARLGQQQGQRFTQSVPPPREGAKVGAQQGAKAGVKEGAKKASIRQAIVAGDKEGAKFRIDPKGRVVADKQAAETIKQGFSDGAVATVKNAPKADRVQMLRMLETAERGLKNPLERARSRPSDVIGESVMRRWQKVSEANMKARQDINAAAQSKLKGTTVDVTDVLDDFADDLDNLGVQLSDDGLVFRGSQIEGSDVGAIKRVFDRLKGQDDGLSLHRLKQYIDSQIDWDKPGKPKPLDAKAVNALKKLRNGINEKLKAQSPEYAEANARASETFGVMGDMMDVMGRRFDPMSENAGVYAGQELRKVLSNYQKRADLIQAIDKLDEMAGKYGGQFSDDPINQVVFLNDMERLFGSFADNSFQGGIEKGVGRAVNMAAGRTGMAETAADVAVSTFNRLTGKSEEGAIRAMRELLKRE